jgi:hypothetical protein
MNIFSFINYLIKIFKGSGEEEFLAFLGCGYLLFALQKGARFPVGN